MKAFRNLFLLISVLFIFGCGGGSDFTSNNGELELEKTAKVSLNFVFPESEPKKSVISNMTTHLRVVAWQWKKNKNGGLEQVHAISKVIDKTTPSATLDLFPLFTNICVTQWNGNPNDIYTARKLETVCSSGYLKPGSNSVVLKMIRGEWILEQPFAFNNSTSLVSFTLLRKNYPLTSSSQQVQSLIDTTWSSYSEYAMAKFNYGSEYSVTIKTDKDAYYCENDKEIKVMITGSPNTTYITMKVFIIHP